MLLMGTCVAVLDLLVAAVAYVRRTHPARSFAITVFLIAGFLMLPANVGYHFYVGPQSARIGATLSRSPSKFSDLESVHLDKMMNGFRRSYRLDGTVALLGLLVVAVDVAARSSKLVGVGLGVAL